MQRRHGATWLVMYGFILRADFLEFEDFIAQCYHAIDVIKAHTKDIAVLVGGPAATRNRKGKTCLPPGLYEVK